jgi:protein O-GlcNAc transferase
MSLLRRPGKATPVSVDRRQREALARASSGDFSPLAAYCRDQLKTNPKSVFALTNLAVCVHANGDYFEAIRLCEEALAVDGQHATALSNLTMYFCEVRNWRKALEFGHRAAAAAPSNSNAWLNLSWAANSLGQFPLGEQASKRALSLDRGSTKALNNLANALKGQGRISEAIPIYERLVLEADERQLAASNLMLALQYDETASTDTIVDWARKIGQMFMESASHKQEPRGGIALPQTRGKLRLGFLSPDFNDHAVMYFVEPLLCRIDRSRFETVAFYLYQDKDDVTRRVERFTDYFVVLSGRKTHDQAAEIRRHNIDLLIDLAGHTAKTGLPAMAYRPAPLQATWLGYPGTTGLPTIDFRITDTIVDANATPDEYTEELLFVTRTPFCVYRPCTRQPLKRYWREFRPAPTPALANGYVTFGCCNNISKITPRTVKLWGSVMARLPTARLLIEGKSITEDSVRSLFLERFTDVGVKEDRLLFVERDPRNQYLTYHKIDIALDTAPLTGGTTTMDLLWFGVPLVTLGGKSFRERMSVSFLSAIGRPEWIAESEEQYVSICENLAKDINALNQIRLAQRQQVEHSPLMNEEHFVENFEQLIIEKIEEKNVKSHTKRTSTQVSSLDRSWVVRNDRTRIKKQEVIRQMKELYSANAWGNLKQLCVDTIESLPNEPYALSFLAAAEWRAGSRDRACDYLSAALDNHPNARAIEPLLSTMTSQLKPQGTS